VAQIRIDKHIRRKFFEAYKTLDKDKRDDSPSAKGVAYCDALFGLERELAHLAPKERFKRRDKESKPLLEEFYQWIDSTYALPKSLLGTAIGYAKSQRKYIYNYLLDGRLEISNNRAERSIKPFVIGRKNWMFSVSPAGARTSAMYYSLLISARENGLNPYEYLVYIFSQAPNLGKAGYAASFSDLLPTSDKLPADLYVPKPEKHEPEIYPWEEE
jgi:transposase